MTDPKEQGLVYTPPKTVAGFMQSDAKMRVLMGPVGCTSGDTEFLTPSGWKRIDAYQEGDLVGQWADGVLEFVQPTGYIDAPCDELILFRSEHALSMALSSEHRMLLGNWRGEQVVKTAERVAKHPSRHTVPVNFAVARPDAPVSDDELRLAVALNADGHTLTAAQLALRWAGNHTRVVTLRKPRKRQRLEALLSRLGIPYTLNVYQRGVEEAVYRFRAEYAGKRYSGWHWWALSQRQLEIVLDEMRFWDGLAPSEDRRTDDVRFYSCFPGDADFIQYAAHACGGRATIAVTTSPVPEWADQYVVHVAVAGSRKAKVMLRSDTTAITRIPAPGGRKYCFSVPSTFWVARHDRRVFVTGNSGKSVGCVMEIPRRAAATPPMKDGIRRSRWAVIRNTMPQLKDTTIKTFLDWLRPGVAGEWKSTEKTFILRFGDVEAEILFRALDDANDVSKLLSLELTGAWINECRSIPKDIIEPLAKRCGRYPRKEEVGPYWHGMWADTNPPNLNSWWWQMMEGRNEEGKPAPSGWAVYKQPSGRSPEAENIENLPDGYYSTEGMSEDFIRVYVDGMYGLSKLGVPVYDKTFKRALHVTKDTNTVPFASTPIIIGMDFGRTPAAALGQVQGGGRVVLLDECVGFNMGLETFLRTKLRPMLQTSRYMGQRVLVVGDPAGAGKDSYSEENAYDVLKRLGFDARPAVSNKPPARLGAVERLLLELVEGKPTLQVDEDRCPMLVGGFEHGYVYTEVRNANGEIKASPNKNEFSHVHDALQYLALYAVTSGGALKPFSREFMFGDDVPTFGRSWENTAGWT